MKKRLCLAMACLMILCLCGCSLFDGNADDLLAAPRLEGDLAPVQKALEASISGKYTLRSPRNGEHRSAVTVADLDGDGQPEAVAFYSTVEENTVNLHLALVDCPDGVWKVAAEEKLVAAGVDRLVLSDLDNDGVCEVLVGWNLYTNVERKVCVYEYTGTTLLDLQEETYNAFCVCDLNDDFHNELLVVELSNENASAIGRYYAYGPTGVNELGECVLDNGVSGYYDPVVTKTPSGGYCVLLDGTKGAGIVTQVIRWNEAGLSAFPPDGETDTSRTYRTSLTQCRDFDRDGIVEIPLTETFPLGQTLSPNQQTVLTIWAAFDNETLIKKQWVCLNENDGYYFELSEEETHRLTVIRSNDGHIRTVYAYDGETQTVGEELFSLRCVTQSEFRTGNFADTSWQVLNETENNVYLYSHTAAGVKDGYEFETVRKQFRLLDEVKA